MNTTMSDEKLFFLYQKTGDKSHFRTIRERLHGKLREFLTRALPSERRDEIPGLVHAAFQAVGQKRRNPTEDYSVLGLLFQKGWRMSRAI